VSEGHGSPRQGQGTTGIHGTDRGRGRKGPVVQPLMMSSTFFGGRGESGDELLYTRYGNNPGQLALAEKIAALEGAEDSLPMASGMGAMSMTLLALTEAGSHVVASRHLYGATRTFLERELPRRGVSTTFIEPDGAEAWRSAIRPETRLLLLEVPTNPLLRVFDPRVAAGVARERNLPLVADVTFASPINLRSLDHGVTLAIHSATKYLGGHSDLIAGVVSGPSDLIASIRGVMKLYGPSIDPHAAWLLDRGIKTLEVRMERHNRNALALAEWFREQAGVSEVIYPGLPSHPDHVVAREILRGFGGMLGVVLEGGGVGADGFCEALELALLAPSLGGVETLVSQPRHTSHMHLPREEREALGIRDGFVRISVGLENIDDLAADFGQALEAARATR
jgi:cystathionine beta-lyase/cystathionine gamma-synthase